MEPARAGGGGGGNMRSKMPLNTKAERGFVIGESFRGSRIAGGRGGRRGQGWRPVVRPDCRFAGWRPHVTPLMLLDMAGVMHSLQWDLCHQSSFSSIRPTQAARTVVARLSPPADLSLIQVNRHFSPVPVVHRCHCDLVKHGVLFYGSVSWK